MTNPEKDLSHQSKRERREKEVRQPADNLHRQIISLLERLESQSEETAAAWESLPPGRRGMPSAKELSKLVRMLITENSEQKEKIRKLHEKEAKIREVLKTKLGLDL